MSEQKNQSAQQRGQDEQRGQQTPKPRQQTPKQTPNSGEKGHGGVADDDKLWEQEGVGP